MTNQAQCACKRVQRETGTNDDGTKFDRWACDTCGTEFTRMSWIGFLQAQVEDSREAARMADRQCADAEHRHAMADSVRDETRAAVARLRRALRATRAHVRYILARDGKVPEYTRKTLEECEQEIDTALTDIDTPQPAPPAQEKT